MQGRAVAVYALVFFLVAAAGMAFVSVAEGPEPGLDSPEHAAAQGDHIEVEGPDGNVRNYTVTGFGEQVGEPTAELTWTDENAQTVVDLEHAAEPDGTTVVSDGTEYWVIVPQDQEEFDTMTLLEVPDANVTMTGEDQWLVEANGTYEPIENFDLEQLEFGVGDTFPVTEEVEGDGEEGESETVTREYYVNSIDEEVVSVNYTEPAEQSVQVRQTDRAELNGVEYTAHFPNPETVQLTSDPDAIESYFQTHEDLDRFEERIDGLQMGVVLSVLAALLLLGLAFLPRRE